MAEGIKLKQIYAKKDQLRGYKAGQYTHAHLSRSMRKVIKRQTTIVSLLHRGITRKMSPLRQAVREASSQPIIGHLKADH